MTSSRLIAALAASGASLMAIAPAAAETSPVEQTYEFAGFSAVSFNGVFDVEITVGGDFAVSASGAESEMSRVEVTLKNGVLTFDQSRKRDKGDREAVDVAISMPALTEIDVLGVAEVGARGVDSEGLKIRLSGVGEVGLEGSCGELDAQVSGVGELDAEELQCRVVDVQVSGVGEAEVFASERVRATVSGVGEITVYGAPADVEKKSGLFGSVTVK